MHDTTSNQAASETDGSAFVLTRDGEAAAADDSAKGVAFEIRDLILAKSWAAFNDSRIFIRLDHGSEDEEYEEIIEFRKGVSSPSRVFMWRNNEAVFVQPMPGSKRRYASVAEALGSLLPKQPVILTDIIATAWPFCPSAAR
jgi:hypothetical protein